VKSRFGPLFRGRCRRRVSGLEGEGISRAAVNPLRYAVRASRKPGAGSMPARSTHASHPRGLREKLSSLLRSSIAQKVGGLPFLANPAQRMRCALFFTPRSISAHSDPPCIGGAALATPDLARGRV
jgi:hypothetical protein